MLAQVDTGQEQRNTPQPLRGVKCPLPPSVAFKVASENEDTFEVEFEACPRSVALEEVVHPLTKDLQDRLAKINAELAKNAKQIEALDTSIDNLTCHADAFDYATAVICGLIGGVVDSLWVGEWDFATAKASANEDVNRKIMAFAKKCGYKGDRLQGAINHLERKFPFPGDNDWKGKCSSTTAHHLDDFSHHPTFVGLIFSIIKQFTGETTYFTSKGNVTIPVEVHSNGTLQGNTPITKVFCGVVNWFINCREIIRNTKGHWMSDLAGSSQASKGGAGLPGSFMSLMKEFSGLPIFSKTDANGNVTNAFAEFLRKAYMNGIGEGNGQVDLGIFNGLFEGASSKFDYRTELAVKKLLGKQAVPILIMEGLVRGTYFIRRLIQELKAKESLAEIDWKKTLPIGNRTVERMMTIATGTFTACDLLDATIRSGIKNGFDPKNPLFWKDFVLRVNFVGIGRFAIAVGADVGMGIARASKVNRRIEVKNVAIHLHHAKLFYKGAAAWIVIKEAEEAVCRLQEEQAATWNNFGGYLLEIKETLPLVSNLPHSTKQILSGSLRDF